MKRGAILRIVISSVAIYVALIIGLRYLLATDKTGSWAAAVAGATGVATAVLTGVLVGVTWLYVRLTGRIVELETTAPARVAEQQTLREFLKVFPVAESVLMSMKDEVEHVLSFEEITWANLIQVNTLIDKKLEEGFDAVDQLYGVAQGLPFSMMKTVLEAARDANRANHQLRLLLRAVLAEAKTITDGHPQITWSDIKNRYNAEVRVVEDPPESRDEWEEITSVSSAKVALSKLRAARSQVWDALNRSSKVTGTSSSAR